MCNCDNDIGNGFPTKDQALDSLRRMVDTGSSPGALAQYEQMAWVAGASVEETEAILKQARSNHGMDR